MSKILILLFCRASGPIQIEPLRGFAPPVPLSHCPTVQLSNCPTVQLSNCPTDSLSDTKPAKNIPQNILRRDLAGDLPEVVERQAQVNADQVTGEARGEP